MTNGAVWETRVDEYGDVVFEWMLRYRLGTVRAVKGVGPTDVLRWEAAGPYTRKRVRTLEDGKAYVEHEVGADAPGDGELRAT